MENKVKNNIKNNEEREDRLNSLPNDILAKILSLLPTNNAVGTAVLSRRWVGLWTRIDSLDFIIQNTKKDDDTQLSHISKIVNQIISPCIRKIIFRIKNPDEKKYLELKPNCRTFMESCLREMCNQNIEEIEIRTLEGYESRYSYMHILYGVLQISSLVVLQLCPCLYYKLPGYKNDKKGVFNLPNLKKLSINLYSHTSFEEFDELIRSCPSLEDLFFWIVGLPYSYACINISSIKLKQLGIDLPRQGGYNNLIISIDTPNLVKFLVFRPFADFEFVTNPISLVEATVDCSPVDRRYNYWLQPQDEQSFLVELFREISNVRSLVLYSDYQDCDVDSLQNMTNLTWTIQSVQDFNKLLILLESCPLLESLILEFCCEENTRWGNSTSAFVFKNAKKVQVNVDETMLNENLLRLVRYFLSGAKLMEQLIVSRRMSNNNKYCQDECKKEKQMCKTLYKCERPSSGCQIMFHGKYFQAEVPNGEIVMLPPSKPKW